MAPEPDPPPTFEEELECGLLGLADFIGHIRQSVATAAALRSIERMVNLIRQGNA